MKLAIVVHGRFHAFDLARELIKQGHSVTLFTNYPKWAVRKWGIPPGQVRSFWLEGASDRIATRLFELRLGPHPGTFHSKTFGAWAARQVSREAWDVVLCFSGVGEETFEVLRGAGAIRVCHRCSTHIRFQARLLEEEKGRVGKFRDYPRPWIIAREEREYRAADRIWVPSLFSKKSFLEQGVPEEKIWYLPLGVDTRSVRPTPEQVEARCRRILSGEKLRVLYAGTVSFRKGVQDLQAVIHAMKGEPVHFQVLGPVLSEARKIVESLQGLAEFIPKQPYTELPRWYAQADLFLFPTIEDGYPLVLAQARASGLPILTTHHGNGPELVEEGKTGWLFPIHRPQEMADRLRWCAGHREELERMARRSYEDYRPRDWSDVARELEAVVQAQRGTDRAG